MNTYEEEIFNYLTKKENFTFAYEIYQDFPKVRDFLVEKFWETVKNSLEEKVKGTDWKVDFSFNKKETELSLKFVESIYIGFEGLNKTPDYFLYIDYEQNKKLDKVETDKHTSDIDAIKDWEKDDAGSYWKYLEDDFTNIETLKKILPENRDDFAQELAKMLFDFGEELKKDISNMCKMTKK